MTKIRLLIVDTDVDSGDVLWEELLTAFIERTNGESLPAAPMANDPPKAPEEQGKREPIPEPKIVDVGPQTPKPPAEKREPILQETPPKTPPRSTAQTGYRPRPPIGPKMPTIPLPVAQSRQSKLVLECEHRPGKFYTATEAAKLAGLTNIYAYTSPANGGGREWFKAGNYRFRRVPAETDVPLIPVIPPAGNGKPATQLPRETKPMHSNAQTSPINPFMVGGGVARS